MRQAGRDRGGQRAPGAVRGGRVDPRPRELTGRALRHEDVHNHVSLEVPTGHEGGPCAEPDQRLPRARHLLGVRDLFAHQGGGFGEVRGHESRERHEAPRDERRGFTGQQPVPRRGHHHRIEHVVRQAVGREPGGDGLHDLD